MHFFLTLLMLALFPLAAAADDIVVPIQPMLDLNGKTKEQIYELRQAVVAKQPYLAPGNYTPSSEVFGQIKGGGNWWGILGLSHYGPGDYAATPPSEESRFLANPYLLVGLDRSNASVVQNASFEPAPVYPEPVDLRWTSAKTAASATYNVTNFFTGMDRTGNPDKKLMLVAYNARDMGYNYIHVVPDQSQNISASDKITQIKQYIHSGASCGYPGGCNNMSPVQPDLLIEARALPATAIIKLWRKEPDDAEAPADFTFAIYMR